MFMILAIHIFFNNLLVGDDEMIKPIEVQSISKVEA